MQTRALLADAKSGTGFLQSYFLELAKPPRRMSQRNFAKKLGYSNPSLVSEILRGKKKMNGELVNRFASYAKLDPLEQTFLMNLVLLESPKTIPNLASKIDENERILDVWSRVDGTNLTSLTAIDMIIHAAINGAEDAGKETSLPRLIRTLGALLDEETIRKRVEKLKEGGYVVERDGALRCERNIRVALKSHASILPVLHKAQSLPKSICKQNVFSFACSQETYARASGIFQGAIEKIAVLLAEEDRKPKGSASYPVYAFYSAFFRATEIT